MSGASKEFDEQLFKVKALALSHKMQIKHEALSKKARAEAQSTGGSVLLYIADREVALWALAVVLGKSGPVPTWMVPRVNCYGGLTIA